MEFSIDDKKQFNNLGINISEIERQLLFFKKDFPYIKLVKPATINDGIFSFNKKQITELVDIFNRNTNNKIIKFVPASGAATRMFKDLYNFLDEWDGSKEISKPAKVFIENIKKFAFYEELKKFVETNYRINISSELNITNYTLVVTTLLNKLGLNYGNLPKAVLQFHKYNSEVRTALEEHVIEGIRYSKTLDKIYIHFTVSSEHAVKFKSIVSSIKNKYQSKYNIKLNISYSEQKSKTDTIAVTTKNIPFRTSNNKLFFRPGGHGALIYNLNELDGNIIFIKNIDNVIIESLLKDTITYKKVIGGLLIKLRNKIFEFLNKIDNNKLNMALKSSICKFYKDYFFLEISKNEKPEYYYNLLNRPIRVCGMVRNEGEPGGGPFWVINNEKKVSLQIIESSQINHDNKLQEKIFKGSTHFNPVDLVCSIYNHKGEKFNLSDFIDHNTGFISNKSKDGVTIKALELPGLWNGAMSDWNTVFVEVPLSTFNPVKTVNDLLRKEHQA